MALARRIELARDLYDTAIGGRDDGARFMVSFALMRVAAIGSFTGMFAGSPLPPAERKLRLASIAGMAIALGANPQNARSVAEQFVATFGDKVFGRSLFGKERRDLPPDVNQEIEQLGRLLLAGASQHIAYPVGCWAVALAHEALDGSHFRYVQTWVGQIAGTREASEAFAKYVRENG